MLGSKPMSQWVAEYALSHQHPINRTCHTFGIPMIAASVLAVIGGGGAWVGGVVVPTLWWYASGAAFVAGWILQFIGHAVEGKPPEFFRDWRFLFVGLRWWWAKVRGVATVLLMLGTLVACGKSAGGGPAPTSPGASTPGTGTSSAWATEGQRFSATSMGFSTPMADSTTLQLTDGRWRMFLFAGDAYRSLISTDGLTFTAESGTRLPRGYGHSRILRLSDGRVRMFSISQGGIASLISSDEGVTFTEEGMRITAGQAGLGQLSGPGIVRLSDGRWRMYFSELDVPGAAIVPLPMKSATSSDLLTWTMDAGVRVGPGATLSGSAAHPAAVVNTNGSVTVFYFRNADTRLWAATAADGLAFTSETPVLSQAADPDVVTLPGGGWRMYYNWFDSTTGYTLSSARAMSSLSAVDLRVVMPPGGGRQGGSQQLAGPGGIGLSEERMRSSDPRVFRAR
jgi:hypothetical protein